MLDFLDVQGFTNCYKKSIFYFYQYKNKNNGLVCNVLKLFKLLRLYLYSLGIIIYEVQIINQVIS
jgi:hypothetical protein